MEKYIKLIKNYSKEKYLHITKQPDGLLKYPFIVPGTNCYATQLWDWDSYFTDVGITQIMLDNNTESDEFFECEKGCVLNYLINTPDNGKTPIVISSNNTIPNKKDDEITNIHKPCLIQHIAFISKKNNNNADWVKPYFNKAEAFLNYYFTNCRHQETGLYFWNDDSAIGVDNDPCTYFRPKKSSASVYLNCFMYKELLAMVYVCSLLNVDYSKYEKEAENLKNAINECMWDERNGFYYSVDLNLLPVDPNQERHKGAPRNWSYLVQKIDVWSGIMPMWCGIADEKKAERMVKENLLNENIFNCNAGIRTLSKQEKMYQIVKTGNPSCWLGPVWGISNYISFKALLNYGYEKEAKALAQKTILILGKSIETVGDMHEYYNPDTCEGVNNPGFQSWNFLANSMIAYLENRSLVSEF